MRFALVVGLGLAACAAEAPERPPPATTRASAAPLPMPTTAFTEEGASVPDPRFETRRIDATPTPTSTPARAFAGRRIDLDLKNTDLHEVFRLLADVGRVNIVVGGEVTGTITLVLKDVPWDQALDVIVRARGLAMERQGNVILVGASR